MLPRYVNSCTGSTVFPFTVSEDGVGPELRFCIFVLARETWRSELVKINGTKLEFLQLFVAQPVAS